VITVPEVVIRSIAAAPQSHIRDLVLATLGLTHEFGVVPEAERLAAIEELSQVAGGPPTQEDLPF